MCFKHVSCRLMTVGLVFYIHMRFLANIPFAGAILQCTYHIRRQLLAGQVFDILVRFVDDFRQLLAVDHLLVHVHRYAILEVRQRLGIGADNLGDGRAPDMDD